MRALRRVGYAQAALRNFAKVQILCWQAAVPDAAGCVGCHTAHATESAPGFVDEAAQSVVCETCHRQRAAWRQE